jgi:hypothetical protein
MLEVQNQDNFFSQRSWLYLLSKFRKLLLFTAKMKLSLYICNNNNNIIIIIILTPAFKT